MWIYPICYKNDKFRNSRDFFYLSKTQNVTIVHLFDCTQKELNARENLQSLSS